MHFCNSTGRNDVTQHKELIAPLRQKIYLRTCAPSNDSDQPAHLESSLGAFWIANGAKFLYADNKDFDQTARMPDLSLRWKHMSEGTFSHVATEMEK